jgi:4'-phosphopantetheinyl transferase
MSGVTIRLFRLDTDAAAFSRCLAVLDREERARADIIMDATARRRFVAAHGILRFSLAEVLSRAPDSLAFAHTPYGKPVLMEHGTPHPLHFSLAHARGLMALAWRFGGALGIDIEDCRRQRLRDLDSIMAHAMTVSEQSRLRMLPGPRRRRAFYRLWTRKEALAKAAGHGFSVAPADIAPDGRRRWRGFAVRDLALPYGFAGALAF